MSKIYELLVETAKRAERETGGKTGFCTLQVFANGAAFADGVKRDLASGAVSGVVSGGGSGVVSGGGFLRKLSL